MNSPQLKVLKLGEGKSRWRLKIKSIIIIKRIILKGCFVGLLHKSYFNVMTIKLTELNLIHFTNAEIHLSQY